MPNFESAGEAEAGIDNGRRASSHYHHEREFLIRSSAGVTAATTAAATVSVTATPTGLRGHGGNAARAGAPAVSSVPLVPGTAATVEPIADAAADPAPGGAQAIVVATGRSSSAKEVAVGGVAITNEFPGSVIWASRDGVLWPAIGQKLVRHNRCVVHFLGPATKSEEEVNVSSLKKFPGGVSLALLRKRLEPKRQLGDKAARDDRLRSDLVYAANEHEQRRQLAIDHAVHLCVRYLWKHDNGVVNVITGKTLDGLDKKQRMRERQERIRMLLEYPEQWTSRADMRRSYQRFRAVFNDRTERAHPLCGQLRLAETSVRRWITRRECSTSLTAVTSPNLEDGGSACDGSAAAEEVSTHSSETLPKTRPPRQPEPSTADGGARGDGGKDNDIESDHSVCSTAEASVVSRRSKFTEGTGRTGGRREVAAAWLGGGLAVTAAVVGDLEACTSWANGGVKPLSRVDFNKPGEYITDEHVASLNLLYRVTGITLDAAFYSNLLGEAARAAEEKALAANNASAAGDEPELRRVDDSGRDRSRSDGDIGPAPWSQNKRNVPGGGGNRSVCADGAGQMNKKTTAPKRHRSR
eukprot:g15684.t1